MVSEARTALIDRLEVVVRLLRETELDSQLEMHGWTAVAVDHLATYFSELCTRLHAGWNPEGNNRINMAVWFDSEGITLKADDVLKTALREAAREFNAVLR